nr:SUMF1/EgtB/PvdO family nonheme iron enzyme [Sphaerospermopsis torques-reginae]
MRMLRGGSWNNNPRNCRSAYRNNNNPDNRNNNNGFRLVVSGASTLQLSELVNGNLSGVQ